MKSVFTELSERAITLHKTLLQFYGNPEWRSPLPPLDELISTMLSQNTNDTNRDRAFNALRSCFPTWEAVRDANQGDVIDTIRSAGLANQKGPRIQAILRAITTEAGVDERETGEDRSLNLDFLRQLSPDQARDWLMQLKGVGPKTAAIVLQFSLNMPAFPVDTHIHRVTGRLGLRPAQMGAEQAHGHLSKLFPPEAYSAVHLNIIRLGREVCQARRPNCPTCPLQNLCDYYTKNYEK